jgi:hypothetical protein
MSDTQPSLDQFAPLMAPGPEPPHTGAYIAQLWEHPHLCLAIFGVQYFTPEGRDLYISSGIGDELFASLGSGPEGLLLNRPLVGPDGPMLLQYWRSWTDLDRYARQIPHTRWWKWLVENCGSGISFYHEIYQPRAAEAIYERGCRAVGPALFCSTQAVRSGEGRSGERQGQFEEAHRAARSAPAAAEPEP